MDALHAGLGQGMAGDLHGHRMGAAIGELAIPHLGQQALQLRRLGRGADAPKGCPDGGRATDVSRRSPRSRVTVVLPFVPVTPIVRRSRAGKP